MEYTDFKKVIEFNVQFDNIKYFDDSLVFNPVVAENCMKLIREELKEYEKAVKESDRLEQLDALCDLKYVALGFCARIGINYDKLKYDYKDYADLLKASFNTDDLSNMLLNENLVKLVQDLEIAVKDRVCLVMFTHIYYIVELTHIIGMNNGFAILEAFNEVHENNMSKACASEEIALQSVLSYDEHPIYRSAAYRRAPDGTNWIIYNKADDKILKPITYEPVNLRRFLKMI